MWQDDVSASPESGIRFNTVYRFKATGETLTSASELRFRTQDELIAQLEAAGFRHLTWQGDWDGSAVSAASRELIVLAR
ncbi:MAG: hypothetical protein QOD67_3759 [Caballeronia sp.]|nr:hypothetical protein [Caballeronia sp.]